jgi:hypothetical protein
MDMLFQLRYDILASVPQYLGHGENPPRWLESELHEISSLVSSVTGSRNSAIQTSGETPSLRTPGGYFLLWPLYLVGAMDITTESLRLWIIKRLQFIWRSGDIQLPVAVAGPLEREG